MPRLIYVKSPAEEREPRLAQMLARIRDDGDVSFQHFSDPAELQHLVENDLAVLLSERFEMASREGVAEEAPLAGALPVPATPLVGRDQDVEAVADLILREGVRLVTLTGPGGVGKTRLALEAARQLGPGFGDGVRFVDLAGVSAADLVPAALATTLGLSTSGSRVITDLESYVRARRLLLVLDNFEHVLGAAPLIARLLGAAPGLVALVTSRSVLRLGGEHEFPVPALPFPDAGTQADATVVQKYASVRLFAERAHAATPTFELTDGNAAAVAEICRRLDGLPLAIELAAARVRLLSPQALLDRLSNRMDLLTGGPRDLPERQHTLRNTLNWSFGLLSPPEQALLSRLGVFAGTFGLPAVEAVSAGSVAAGPDRAGVVMDTLGALVDNSLVQPETRSGQPRFRLLETIREYALDRLRDNGDWTQAHDRHATYFLSLAEPAHDELLDPGQLAWLHRLDTEHENLAAAMLWRLDQDQLEPAVRVVWVTWRFWWMHGHAAELARFGETILAKTERLPSHQRALALSATGLMLIVGGDRARARPLLEQSLPLFREGGDKLDVAMMLGALGHLSASHGEYAAASQLLEDSLALLRELAGEITANERLHERYLQLMVASEVPNFLGQVRLAQGDNDSATRLFSEGLAAARGVPDRPSILVSLYDLALGSQARGDLGGAADKLAEGLSLAAEAGDQTSAAYSLEALAAVARLAGDFQRAVRLFAAARALLEANGSGWLHAYVPRIPPHDDDLAALRSSVGDAAFEEAWAYGRSLAGGQAVEYGLHGQPPDAISQGVSRPR